MKFEKYQKVRRLGDGRTKGILNGRVAVFPKIDGANASVWLDNGMVKGGSRNREVSLENDNQGFYKYILEQNNIERFLLDYPEYRLYGEWLVSHSLKTYKDNAWRKFYVFDVVDSQGKYLPYDNYQPLMEEYDIEYVPPIAFIEGANEQSLYRLLEKNNFLIQDGEGVGEGIVIKNYDYINKYDEVIWAKIVTTEFKERHTKAMGAPEITVEKVIEKAIVEQFVTEAFIEKEFAKIVVSHDNEWRNEYIPELLNRVYYELIEEEMWNILKEFKRPEIDFGLLHNMTINKIKKVKKDVF